MCVKWQRYPGNLILFTKYFFFKISFISQVRKNVVNENEEKIRLGLTTAKYNTFFSKSRKKPKFNAQNRHRVSWYLNPMGCWVENLFIVISVEFIPSRQRWHNIQLLYLNVNLHSGQLCRQKKKFLLNLSQLHFFPNLSFMHIWNVCFFGNYRMISVIKNENSPLWILRSIALRRVLHYKGCLDDILITYSISFIQLKKTM